MDAKTRERVQDLLEQALAVAPPARETWFASQSPHATPATLAEVRSLLASLDDAGGFLADVPPPANDAALREPSGAMVGRYRVVEHIGEGAFGEVYLAEQTEPVRRRVALKVVKAGMDTRAVLRRFAAERQTLAELDHPHIARIYDAGSTVAGRPYFAMEYVPGGNLRRWCLDANPTPRQRLELFAAVCRAVQHAHFHGVIHRDLKPSNILVAVVDGTATPKVIDFGIARVMADDVASAGGATLTGAGSALGTPAYMSPEQIDAPHLADTRSDVYSLGVVLSELLYGGLPFDLDASGRPIRSASQPPALAASGPLKRARAAAGSAGCVIRKCLEPRAADRYESAGALAEDVQRLLRGEPTAAGPGNPWRQAAWAIRRHKRAAAAAAAVVLLVLGALAGTSYGLYRERQIAVELARQKAEADAQRTTAEERRRQAELANQTLQESVRLFRDVLGAASPQRMGRDVTVRAALDAAAGSTEGFIRDPRVEADVRRTLAGLYRDLELWDQSLLHARRAFELRRNTLGPDHRDTLHAMSDLSIALSEAPGRLAEALALEQENLERTRRTLGPNDYETLVSVSNVAGYLEELGRYDEADAMYRDLLARRTAAAGEDAPATLTTLNKYARLKVAMGRPQEAEPMARRAFDGRTKQFGPDDPRTLAAAQTLATALARAGRIDEAAAILGDCLPRAARTMGDDSGLARQMRLTLDNLRDGSHRGRVPPATGPAN